MSLIATRVRGLPLYRALDHAIPTSHSRAKQEKALRLLARNREFEARELARPLSSFVDEDGVSFVDLHMIRFVRMAGRRVSVGDEELRERCRVFGLDASCETWSDLPPEVRGWALLYRREARKRARQDTFTLPEEIEPSTWRSWKRRARELGATFIRLEVSGELHPEPYVGERWRPCLSPPHV